jgi:hypothetical protein
MRAGLLWIPAILGAGLSVALLATCERGAAFSPGASSAGVTYHPCGLDELETFAGQIPAGWTVVNGGTSAGEWGYAAELPPWFPAVAPVDGGAFIGSNAGGWWIHLDDDLVSPTYDLGSCSSATLSYDHNVQTDETGDNLAEVYVVPGGAATPFFLASYDSDSPADDLHSTTLSITEDQLDGSSSFQVVFHYEGLDGWGWYVDNVGVKGEP